MHAKMMKMHGSSSEGDHKMLAMKKASFEVALKSKKQLANSTLAFTFEKPRGFKFKSGQHIRMTLIDPPETDAEGNSRFLSLASSPEDSDLVFAMRMRNTAFKRVLKCLQPNDKVLIQILLNAPHGAFALHDNATKPAVFLVGGIGIVPAYAMIKDAAQRKLPHKIVLFYSNRRPEDAAFLSELRQLAGLNSNFKLIATMTKLKKSAKAWRGETGRISQTMLKKAGVDLNSSIYYVSGLPEMVSSMQALLKKAGVDQNSIRAEEFTGFNLNEIASDTKSARASLLTLIGITLVIISVAIIHITGANSLFHSILSSLSFKNPVSYLFIGFLLVVVAFKLKVLWALRRTKAKNLIQDFTKLHKLANKK